jgi:ribosomal protein L7/L12
MSAYAVGMWPFRRTPDLLDQQRRNLERPNADGAEERGVGAGSAVLVRHAGPKKIPLIRVLRAETSLGLRECKRVADDGGVVAAGLTTSQADRIVGLLVAVGATAQRVDPAGQ